MDAMTADAYDVCRAVALKLLRASGSATQAEIARVFGVSQQQVARWMGRQQGMGLKPRLAAGKYLEVDNG